jgi:hypothetical protein
MLDVEAHIVAGVRLSADASPNRSGVLYFVPQEPGHQRFEVFHHRTRGDVFARRFL